MPFLWCGCVIGPSFTMAISLWADIEDFRCGGRNTVASD
jgi:hypothetical protein